MSIEEFNFDRLSAPPISMFLTPTDIGDLQYIATSIRYSGNAAEKYKMQKQILNRRGLIKFGAGTNRVVYRHPEFNSILFKIAADAKGITDNPKEFRNQFILKPFVSKMFETTPCGTVSCVERVRPIKNREEFRYIAYDYFVLLNEWILGEYIMADIGTDFFMNVGIRQGFGVVLIDYPYLFRLDGNKLFCNAPNHNSLSGKCGGVIDYDAGYNFLICTKCGVRYRANELELKIKNEDVVIRKEGESKMKISIQGGTGGTSNNVNNKKSYNNRNHSPIVTATGNNEVRKMPGRPKNNNAVKTVNGVVTNKVKSSYSLEEEPEEKVTTEKKMKEDTVNDTSYQKKTVEQKPQKPAGEPMVAFEEKKQPQEKIRDSVVICETIKKDLLNEIPNIKIGLVRNDFIKIFVGQLVNHVDDIEVLKAIRDNLSMLIPEEEKEDEADKEEPVVEVTEEVKPAEVNDDEEPGFAEYMALALESINDLENEKLMEAAQDESLNEFLNNYLDIQVTTINENKIEAAVVFAYDKSIMYQATDINFDDDVEEVKAESSNEEPEIVQGIAYVDGTVEDIRNIRSSEDNRKVILLYNTDGSDYLTDADGNLIAIDRVDTHSIDASEFVSSHWLTSMLTELKEINNDTQEGEEENVAATTEETIGSANMKDALQGIPVGSLPQ